MRARLLGLCIALGMLGAGAGLGSGAGAGGSTIAGTLAPGLTTTEHAALAHAGAFGKHPVHVLLVGDSIALTLGQGLTIRAHSNYGLVISDHATLGCDLDPTLEIRTSGKPGPATPGCTEWRGLWPFLTAAVHPQVVMLGVGRWEVSDHFYQGHWVHMGDPVWDNHVASDLQHAISIFRLFGARVVLFTMPYLDPSDRQPDGQPWLENTPALARDYNAVVERVAHADPGAVTVLDLNKMLSPHGRFTRTVDGVTVRWSDGIHVTMAGGVLLQRQILPVVDRIGLAVEAKAHASRKHRH
jgi:hypothetical protein